MLMPLEVLQNTGVAGARRVAIELVNPEAIVHVRAMGIQEDVEYRGSPHHVLCLVLTMNQNISTWVDKNRIYYIAAAIDADELVTIRTAWPNTSVKDRFLNDDIYIENFLYATLRWMKEHS